MNGPTLYDTSLAGAAQQGWVPGRVTVVRSRRSDAWGTRWWVLRPDGGADWWWDWSDAVDAANEYAHELRNNKPKAVL